MRGLRACVSFEAVGVALAQSPGGFSFCPTGYILSATSHLVNGSAPVDFKTASDRATGACITLDNIADASGVSDSLIRRARLDPKGPSFRRPPPGWEKAVAKLARERAGELVRLAKELER